VAHVVLPESPPAGGAEDTEKPAKFADQAIPVFIEMFTKAGGQLRFANARIVGGAQMFNFGGGGGNSLNIGTRTATAIRAALSQCGIAVEKADVGGNKGKQIRFLVATGQVFVKVVGDRDYML
jgi:chemotaxis protein CheD